MSPRIAINGVAETVHPRGGAQNLEHLIFETASRALAASCVQRSEVDAIVISASDQTDGRAISSMLTAGPAGAYLNHEINIASSPGHALANAYMMVRSGLRKRILITTWGRSTETAVTGGVEVAERLSIDPYFERHALVPSAVVAFQAAAQRARDHGAEAARAVVAKSRTNVGTRPAGDAPLLAYPLRADEVAAEVDGAFSLVVSNEASVSVDDPVYVRGLGWASDSGRASSRDLLRLPHLRAAAERAASMAGLTGLDGAGVYQLHDYSADAELLAIEALGLCRDGEAAALTVEGAFARHGQRPVSPEGGSLSGEAPFGGPMRKVTAAVRQLRNEAREAQVAGASTAVAQIAGAIAGQFQTVVVLDREPRD